MYRILVVEDDEVIAKTIRQHLQSWNYAVFAVAVSYPHLTLPTIREVYISVVAEYLTQKEI